MRDEMGLLPRIPELMMHYEKLYRQADDALMAHNYLLMIDGIRKDQEQFNLLPHTFHTFHVFEMATRGYEEKIAGLQKMQRKILEPRDWDKHFLRTKIEHYYVYNYFSYKG
jgi:hypothetical protein